MKKVLFTVALLFGAFAASAQVSVVKEAKAKKGNPAEAAKIIEAALTNPETANDPETWKLAGDFQKAIYDAENEKLYLSQVDKSKVADLPTLYNSLMKMFEYYMKCDEVEQAKVASGELKKAKLRKNQHRVIGIVTKGHIMKTDVPLDFNIPGLGTILDGRLLVQNIINTVQTGNHLHHTSREMSHPAKRSVKEACVSNKLHQRTYGHSAL